MVQVKDSADSRLQASLNSTASPDTQRKLTGLMSKVKTYDRRSQSLHNVCHSLFYYVSLK
jgi:hypothetical protein